MNANINHRSLSTTSKVETLAKIYLEGEPAEIFDATLAELCECPKDYLFRKCVATCCLPFSGTCADLQNCLSMIYEDIQ